jgi:hypothetical protein
MVEDAELASQEETEATKVTSRLTPTAPTLNSKSGSHNLCTSCECSSQFNCCQQLNLSNSETISPTVIDTINKSTTLDSNFMYDCDIEVKSDSTGHILGVGQINCKIRSSKPIHSVGEIELNTDIETNSERLSREIAEKYFRETQNF